MKSLTKLWTTLALECADECGISIDRDLETVRDRVSKEGISFLTISLPSFCSSFELALEKGRIPSDSFAGFRRSRGLPAFLQGFLRRIFRDNGYLLDEPDVACIRNVRQICLFLKKVEIDCSDDRKRLAERKFVECEEELAEVESRLTADDLRGVSRAAALLFGDAFDSLNSMIDGFELEPRHGSGATADRLKGNHKFLQPEWTERLEEYFPYGEYVLPNWRHADHYPSDLLPPDQERPVRVVFVPKTPKTPRVIAIEPTCMQYMQQGLRIELQRLLEEDNRAGSFVGFTDQEPNREFARKGSLDGSVATLDLSEASDRVLNCVVEAILKPWPSLAGAVQACRSTTAQLPSGRVIPLKKFASMGSALCFPMEEIVFLAIIFHWWHVRTGKPVPSLIRESRGKVRVYGDDIVVPSHMVPATLEALNHYGLKVNTSKSFWNGKFRESCGGDFFMGEWVTPIRATKLLPESRSQQDSIISTMELSNRLYQAGLWRTSEHVLKHLRKLGYGHNPVPIGTGAVAPVTFQSVKTGNRFHQDLQMWVINTHVKVAKKSQIEIDGIAALRKTLSSDFSSPEDQDHLLFSGRPLSVRTKRGWVPAF